MEENQVLSNQEATLSDEEKKMLDACQKYSWLDGKYFTVDINNSNLPNYVTAKCNTCNANVKGNSKTSSNFSGHLKRKHPDEFAEYQVYKKSKSGESSKTNSEKRVTCCFSQEDFVKSVTSFIIESHLPVSIVEKPGFRKIFNNFKIKELKHISAYKVTKEINNLYNHLVENIKVLLSRAECVCTTTDIWSGKKRRFLGVTVHWIEKKNLERKSAVLACTRFPGTHNFENITVLLANIHATFNLDTEKIIATITDNGSNFVKAFKEFGIKDSLCFSSDRVEQPSTDNDEEVLEVSETTFSEAAYNSEDSTVEDSEEEEDTLEFMDETPILPRHFRCASHTLNLIATTDTIKIISRLKNLLLVHQNVINKCNELWKCLSSPKKREELTTYLECNLQRPVETRWNSLYDCLNQIWTLKDKIVNRQMNNIIGRTLLQTADLYYIKEYVDVFKPLSQAIDELQGEQNCHYGFLLPTLVMIRKKWTQLKENTNIVTCQPLIDGLIEKLEDRFLDFFNIEGHGETAAIAALLHPRFKACWVPYLDEVAQQKVKTLSQDLTKKSGNDETAEDPMEDDNDDFFDFAPNRTNPLLTSSFIDNVDHELGRYLEEPSKKIDILKKYPEIKKLFIKYNTPLPSSAPVERLFSQATLLDLPKLNRMSDSLFERRVFCKVNQQSSLFTHS